MRLTLSEMWKEIAIDVGTKRFNNAVVNNYENYGAVEGAQLIFNVKGTVGEAGVAAHFRQPWNRKVGDLKSIDVGKIIEVRGRKPYSDLGIRPAHKDKLRLPHVLVWVYDDYSMDLRGWLFGYEGAHEKGGELDRKRWHQRSGCWYNPPPYRPLDELGRILADEDEVERILQEHLEDVAVQEAAKRLARIA